MMSNAIDIYFALTIYGIRISGEVRFHVYNANKSPNDPPTRENV
jgi:hypothetical protein